MENFGANILRERLVAASAFDGDETLIPDDGSEDFAADLMKMTDVHDPKFRVLGDIDIFETTTEQSWDGVATLHENFGQL